MEATIEEHALTVGGTTTITSTAGDPSNNRPNGNTMLIVRGIAEIDVPELGAPLTPVIFSFADDASIWGHISSELLGGSSLGWIDNDPGVSPVTTQLAGDRLTLEFEYQAGFPPGVVGETVSYDAEATVMEVFTWSSVPEPTTALLLAAGLVGLAAAERRRRS